MKRESLKMPEGDWQRLAEVAAATASVYSGSPSWRRLCLRIARGEVLCKEAPKSKRLRKGPNSMFAEYRRTETRARILKTLCATVQTFMSNPDPALAAAAAAINAELSSAFAAEISPPPAAPPDMAHAA